MRLSCCSAFISFFAIGALITHALPMPKAFAATEMPIIGSGVAIATNASDATATSAGVSPKPALELRRKSNRRYIPGTSLTEDTVALAKMLDINGTLEELKREVKSAGSNPAGESLTRIIYLRQNCQRAIQFAALELEEAISNIDGDLSFTQLEHSLFSAKYDRAAMLNNTATFLTSGTLGILDSATGIKYAAPIPNILGITGNAAAVGIPLWGLRPRKYKSLQSGNGGNMLAPIFDLPYEGEGYDPIVWKYLNTAALDENETLTRREALLARWSRFRDLSKDNKKSEQEIKRLSGLLEKGEKVSLDLLKTRAELLVELRAEIQSLYADLSDLNTEIMKY